MQRLLLIAIGMTALLLGLVATAGDDYSVHIAQFDEDGRQIAPDDMDDLHFAEFRYKDSKRYPDGVNFFIVNNGDTPV